MSTAGRPEVPKSKQMDRDIKFYWKSMIGIMECCSRTGYSSRTVSSRYRMWDEQIKNRQDKQFLESQDRTKNRALEALDKQMTEVLAVQQTVANWVLNHTGEKFPQASLDDHQLELRIKVANMLFEMTDKKASLELTPTLAQKVKEEVQKLVDKYASRPISNEQLSDGR